MQLAREALFVDLVSQVPTAEFAEGPAEFENGFRAECLTGWDQVYVWLCLPQSGRPSSRLKDVECQSVRNIQRRLGFPCWLVQRADESARGQFERLGGWPHFLLCAVKLSPLAVSLGGMWTVQRLIELVHTQFRDQGENCRPVCAITQGSNEIVLFLHLDDAMATLADVNQIARLPIDAELIQRFRLCHGIGLNDVKSGPASEFRRARYDGALRRLFPWEQEEGGQAAADGDWSPPPLSEKQREDAEACLARQPLVSRTNTTLCWQPQRIDGDAGGPISVALSAGIGGPYEWRIGERIDRALARTARREQDATEAKSPDASGSEKPAPTSRVAYGPDDIHAGIIDFGSLSELSDFFRPLLADRRKGDLSFATVSVPVRPLRHDVDAPTGGPAPAARFNPDPLLKGLDTLVDGFGAKERYARWRPTAAGDAIIAGLDDLRIAARALLSSPEIASDADDLISVLCHLPAVVDAELSQDNPWGVVQVLKYLTLAVYEREQTLWAEAAPPGAPFHSQGVGMQQLAKAVEWLIGYIVNYALSIPPDYAAEMRAETRWLGRHRAGQVSLDRDEIQHVGTEGHPLATRRWMGCLCLSVLQGVYTSRGGIVHFTDLFARDLSVNLPHIFHECGHLLWELCGYHEAPQQDELLRACQGAPNEWMRGFGAARSPVVRILEETFAHWVEYELFHRDAEFCIRSLWQNWLTSAYLARHPVDALQRTASILLIDLLLRKEPEGLIEAIKHGADEIAISPGAARRWVSSVLNRTLHMCTRDDPFEISGSVFPEGWKDEFAQARHQYYDAIFDVLLHVILPGLSRLLVRDWEVGINLQCLHEWKLPDCDASIKDTEIDVDVAKAYLDQQRTLRGGCVLIDPLEKPVRQVLRLHAHTTNRGRKCPIGGAGTATGGRVSAPVDAALLFSLAHVWQVNSTYPSFLEPPPQNGGD